MDESAKLIAKQLRGDLVKHGLLKKGYHQHYGILKRITNKHINQSWKEGAISKEKFNV